jgi:hypothetical protein
MFKFEKRSSLKNVNLKLVHFLKMFILKFIELKHVYFKFIQIKNVHLKICTFLFFKNNFAKDIKIQTQKLFKYEIF